MPPFVVEGEVGVPPLVIVAVEEAATLGTVWEGLDQFGRVKVATPGLDHAETVTGRCPCFRQRFGTAPQITAARHQGRAAGAEWWRQSAMGPRRPAKPQGGEGRQSFRGISYRHYTIPVTCFYGVIKAHERTGPELPGVGVGSPAEVFPAVNDGADGVSDAGARVRGNTWFRLTRPNLASPVLRVPTGLLGRGRRVGPRRFPPSRL